MIEANLVPIHNSWSSTATRDRLSCESACLQSIRTTANLDVPPHPRTQGA